MLSVLKKKRSIELGVGNVKPPSCGLARCLSVCLSLCQLISCSLLLPIQIEMQSTRPVRYHGESNESTRSSYLPVRALGSGLPGPLPSHPLITSPPPSPPPPPRINVTLFPYIMRKCADVAVCAVRHIWAAVCVSDTMQEQQ